MTPLPIGLGARLSLRTRVALVLAVSFSAFVLAFLHTSLSSRAADLRADLLDGGRTSLALIRRSVAEQALLGDYAAIQQTLSICAARRDVGSVLFRDEAGKTLSAASKETPPEAPRWVYRLLFREEAEPLVEEVMLGGVRYGWLRLQVDEIPATNRLYEVGRAQLAASLAFVVAILGVSWWSLRANLRILQRLEDAAQRFQAGDYSARVSASPRNAPELRQTAAAFDAMGERIGRLLTALSEQTRAVDNAAILVEAGMDGRVASVNGRFLVVTGRFGADVVGRPLTELLPSERAEPAPTAPWVSLGPGAWWRGEVPVRRAGGRTAWLDLAVTPIAGSDGRPEKLLAIGFDVTERRRAAAELRESRQMLLEVIDTIPQMVFWKDRESVYLGCNRNFAGAVGLSDPAEVVGMTDFDLPRRETSQAEAYRRVDREVMESGKARLRFFESLRLPGGETVYIEESKVPLHDADGTVVGVLGTYEDVTERRAFVERIEHLAFHDGLTGLPNRTLLEERLTRAIASARRRSNAFAVLFLDLDGFKEVNDRHGHEVGDEFLRALAGQLSLAVREEDTVARFGGDEFVILLVDQGRRGDVRVALDRILAVIRKPIRVRELLITVSASIGVALYPDDDPNGEALLRHADVAMYHAKERGRDGFEFFDRDMVRAAAVGRHSTDRVAAGFHDGQFELLYQPTVNMRTGEVTGVEALVRWNEPGHGVRLPSEFLPEIENSDLIVEIGTWVLEEALSRAEAWGRLGLSLRVGVNVAARQIQHAGFLEVVRSALARHPEVAPSRLELEILETTALEDLAVVQGVLTRCREVGIRFCLDDFGTGYSSLSYLKRLPVDVVKIDQGFVRDMLEDREDLAIVQGILSMAAIFGREVVAEGLSTAAQGLKLLELGCDVAQGFGIARPMPGDQVPDWVSRWRPDPLWRNVEPREVGAPGRSLGERRGARRPPGKV